MSEPTNPCPCCTGKDEGEVFDLCDPCLAAALAGVYPHDCGRPAHAGYPKDAAAEAGS